MYSDPDESEPVAGRLEGARGRRAVADAGVPTSNRVALASESPRVARRARRLLVQNLPDAWRGGVIETDKEYVPQGGQRSEPVYELSCT